MSGFPLYLMRHGMTELTGRMVGHLDCDVLPEGVSACLGKSGGLDVARIISSDLRRASACAEAIGPFQTDARWRELDFGEWDGKAVADIDADALARFWDDPDAYPPPGGEQWSTLVARVEQAIAALTAEPTLVVTHGGAMRAALHVLCGFSLAQTWSFDLPCASMVELCVWEGVPRTARIRALRP